MNIITLLKVINVAATVRQIDNYFREGDKPLISKEFLMIVGTAVAVSVAISYAAKHLR